MTSTRISRREFLQLGAGAAAGVAIAGSGMATFLTKEARATPALTPFVDALPIPPLLVGANQSLRIAQTTQMFHTGLPPTTVWGYEGGGYSGYLGPTIEAVKGTPTSVSYLNDLPPDHLLEQAPPISDPHILTHLHGGHISDIADGNPYATPSEFVPGQTQPVKYENDQDAAHLWYHDHALGITRLNVMAGLAGNYFMRDTTKDTGGANNFGNNPTVGLPYGEEYEFPLVIQDRAFTSAGQLVYPSSWEPEFFGDVVAVNGTVWPYKRVEPRRYRCRILNGSNSRFYNLRLTGQELTGGTIMTQIGTDGGLLPQPVKLDKLLLGPGERADVIFDFTGVSGRVDLVNTALPPTTISPAPPLQRNQIMRFQVNVPLNGSIPNKQLPDQLSGPFSMPGQVVRTRFLTLEEELNELEEPVALTLNGLRFNAVDANGSRVVTELPKVGDTEVWALINLSADTHPIHLHLVQFQILSRKKLDVGRYEEALEAARGAAGDSPVNANGQLVNPDPTPYIFANAPVGANEMGPNSGIHKY